MGGVKQKKLLARSYIKSTDAHRHYFITKADFCVQLISVRAIMVGFGIKVGHSGRPYSCWIMFNHIYVFVSHFFNFSTIKRKSILRVTPKI